MASPDTFMLADSLLPVGLHHDDDSGKLHVDEITPELVDDLRSLTALIASQQNAGDHTITLEEEFAALQFVLVEIISHTSTDGIKRAPSAILASAFDAFPLFVAIPEIATGSKHIDFDPDRAAWAERKKGR